jgi:hypothetical protein
LVQILTDSFWKERIKAVYLEKDDWVGRRIVT